MASKDTEEKIPKVQEILEKNSSEPKIINLSKKDLTIDEIKILERGLKFTPTPKCDKTDLINDTEEFCRKLRLCEFFQNNENEDKSLVRNKKGFKPPSNRDKHLDDYIMCLKKTAESNMVQKNIKPNISRSEQDAIQSLRGNSNIVIKEADKGGAVVIMDSDHYKQMSMDQLSDVNFYQHLDQNEDCKAILKIKKFVRVHGDNLTKNEKDYLINYETKTSNFYGLPKIHKSKEIQEKIKTACSSYVKIPKPEDLKLRPIIAGPSSPTQRLSNLLDLVLKPLCKKVPSYIRDDLDFLNHIPENVQPETLLVSFDVTSLYTNIPHSLGIDAVRFWMEKFPEGIDSRFSKEFILEGLRLILENNNFHFDNQFFLQTKGTAMGTKVAPTYATLVMGFLEEKLYSVLPDVFDEDTSKYIRENWKRYLDDCFIFWNRSEEDLQKFHSTLNSLHVSLKFTMEMNHTKLPFLDILIIKNHDVITTDLYCKDTDTHQYLDFRSCHPSHTKRNIPFNLAKRICTIVSDPELRLKRLEELKTYLIKQHYPENLINAGINKSLNIPLTELRKTKPKEDQNPENIPFVVTHNPRNHNILGSAKRFLPILEQSNNMKNLLRKSNIINSRRQAPNLKKLLSAAKFTSTDERKCVKRCGDPRCGTCVHLEEGNEKILKSGKRLNPNASMDCKTLNVIYCLTCPTCGEHYIGQTNKLNARVRVHKQQIRDPSVRNTPCCEHFANCGGGNFKIFPFYKMWNENEIARQTKEDYFIRLFNPKLNSK